MSAVDDYGYRGGEADGDRLPWLESAEPERPEGPTAARIVLLVVLGLVLLGAIVFGIWRMQQSRGGSGGSGELIAAQEGDYKIRPDDPGGLKVEGEGDSAIAASAGVNQSAAIDLRAVPEAPITPRRGTAPSPAASNAGKTATVSVPAASAPLRAQRPMIAPSAPVPGAGSGGSLVQLGAFPTEAAANTAWSAIARRFGYVAQLGKSVERADVNGRTVFRLRVNAGSAGAAADICGRLKVAGEGCFVTG